MPANRRNFWILLSVLAVIVSGARWLDMNQSYRSSHMCMSSKAACGVPYTPRFADAATIDHAPQVTNLEQVKRQIARSYSCKARRHGLEGSITARVLVDERGNYLRHRIISSTRCGLKHRCEPYLSQLTFEPAVRNQRPVRAWTNVRIELGY